MAALVWAGSRRVPSGKFRIWAHADASSMGFELPKGTPQHTKVIRG